MSLQTFTCGTLENLGMPTILLTVDSLRADHLGQYGYCRDTMPVLDRLTGEGTIFERGFANGPYTRVSIPSFHTSRYLSYGNLDAFPTIASILRTDGIHTAAIGTQTGIGMVRGEFGFEEMLDLGHEDFDQNTERTLPQELFIRLDSVAANVSDWLQQRRLKYVYNVLSRPYNVVFGTFDKTRLHGYTSAEEVTDRAISWLRDQNHSEFFLWLHYMEAHRPYGIHDEEPAYLDEPEDERAIWDLMRTAGTEPDKVSAVERKQMIDLYDSDIRYCSRHLARLFDILESEGLWETSNIIFSSDHGEEFHEHGRFFHRNFPYDELIHVPLIVKPAAQPPIDRVSKQRSLLDLAPTICSFFDVDTDEYRFLGTPLYEGDERDVIALGQPGMDVPAVAVRTPNWKYIQTVEETQLYNIQTDPSEGKNVVEDHPRVTARFRQKIPERLFERDTKAPRPPEDEVDKEQLEALGYMELREADT